MTADITVIRNAAYVIEFDRDAERHVYRKDADVAFGSEGIVYCGTHYQGAFDRQVDGSRRMVMPGLISIHGHSSSAVKAKGCWEELGSPRIYMSTLFEYQSLIGGDPADFAVMCHHAAGEMLRSGCTSTMDIHGDYEGWVDTLAQTGIRGFVAPMFSSARYRTPNGHTMEYSWDEAAGEAGLARAIDVIKQAKSHPSGRMDGVMSPGQVDTCTADLLRDCVAEAEALGVPRTIHASQSVHEFREMVDRHGLSPMEFLDDIGFLSDSCIIGHGIFIDDHPWIHQYPRRRDRKLLADNGCTVAHCPAVIARRGILLNHFQSYLDAGINIGIGMDIFPHNMIDEMRWGLVSAKCAAGSQHGTHISAMLYAATRGGARALGRDDLGIIEAGAQADLVLVDLDHPDMQPLHDPLYALVFTALERPVREVFVAGRQVVSEGRVETVDMPALSAELTQIQERGLSAAQGNDPQGRTVDQLFPASLAFAQ